MAERLQGDTVIPLVDPIGDAAILKVLAFLYLDKKENLKVDESTLFHAGQPSPSLA